jgi:hypothetical protein
VPGAVKSDSTLSCGVTRIMPKLDISNEGIKYWLFGNCRGKHMFSVLVLARHKAMYQKQLMADSAKKREELICAVLMR